MLRDVSPDLAMNIIETTLFTKNIMGLLDDDEVQRLLDDLIAKPDMGDIIKGGGGIRKLRWCVAGKGKRGGLRIIYYWQRGRFMYLLMAYPKSKKDDLSATELRILKAVVQEEKRSWIRSSLTS